MNRILLVDDEAAILFAYKKVLQRPLLIVDTAKSVEQTMALLESNLYDAAILDLRLGGDSCEEGFELLQAIKRRSPATRVIMITAYGNSEIKEKAHRLGAEFYFEKPVSTRVIQETLRQTGIQFVDDQLSRVIWKFQ